MNVCHEGSPIVTFREAWHAEEEAPPAAEAPDERSREYCRVREAAERAAAKKASSLHAQRIHQELAQAYALRANGSRTKC
jgi:hypothetical protein